MIELKRFDIVGKYADEETMRAYKEVLGERIKDLIDNN